MKQTGGIHDIVGKEVQGKVISANQLRSDTQVSEKKSRCKFTAAYKLRILQEYEACINQGEKEALLRREGLYHSNICTWG